ncbi:hypothetical protein [Streptomyces sp. NPDC088748]|uniref:hypothetical protein n=1 Tax=Streptomyces sp. NPDC088748 TaxID=3365887 RepID=UPI003813041D
MSDEPLVVVVQPPDRRGLREVLVRGETAGRVWSERELHRLLDECGLREPDIEWRGAGADVWPDHRTQRFASWRHGVTARATSGPPRPDTATPERRWSLRRDTGGGE